MSLARILGKSKGKQTFASDSRWVLPTCFIGLEHEYEGVKSQTLPHHTFGDLWTYHEEGSLRDQGAEYVFSTPLFGADAGNALEWLVSHAKSSGWKCSKRTGIHVHLDVRDLTAAQLSGLSIIYAAVEPMLYRWIGDGRDASHFCIPLYRADEALLAVCGIVRSAWKDDKEDGHNTLHVAEAYQRYAGFNLQALHKFGSIEFRQLQTTHDVVRIQDWINMIMSLKATALKLPQSDGAVVRMIQQMGARELLYYVFPGELAAKLYTSHSEEEFRSRGLVSARDIAVHGCSGDQWVRKTFPKGQHKGFATWYKEFKSTKSKDAKIYSAEMEDEPRDEPRGLFVQPERAEANQPDGFVPMPPRIEPMGWEEAPVSIRGGLAGRWPDFGGEVQATPPVVPPTAARAPMGVDIEALRRADALIRRQELDRAARRARRPR